MKEGKRSESAVNPERERVRGLLVAQQFLGALQSHPYMPTQEADLDIDTLHAAPQRSFIADYTHVQSEIDHLLRTVMPIELDALRVKIQLENMGSGESSQTGERKKG